MLTASDAAGLLYVEVECPPELEVEFHAWYNREHIPERLRIPGFMTGQRYAALEGRPRWLATYELDNAGVLESAEYLRWAGPLRTPWTERMVTSTRVRRSVFRKVHETRGAGPPGASAGLLAVRYAEVAGKGDPFAPWHDQTFSREVVKLPGVRGAARFEDMETGAQLAVYGLADPWATQEPAFARAWMDGWEARRARLEGYQRNLYIRIL